MMGINREKYIQSILPKEAMYFKEELVDDILTIPCQKPNMERVLDIVCAADIESYKLIETDIGNSYEGQKLTGQKLVVEVRIKEKLTYVADELSQSAHAAHYEKLKSVFVILPQMHDGHHICDLVRANRVSITPYIEGVCYRQLNERDVHRCLMLFVDVRVCK